MKALVIPVVALTAALAGCHQGAAKRLGPAAETQSVEVRVIDWRASGEYQAGQWRFAYNCRGLDGPPSRSLQRGHLTYKGFGLHMSNEHFNDWIQTPWDTMYWAGTWRHPWGYQGWEPRPTPDHARQGSRRTAGQILAMQILEQAYGTWRERLSDRLAMILAELPAPRADAGPGVIRPAGPGVDHVSLVLWACRKVLEEAPERRAAEPEAKQARRLAQAPDAAPVMRVGPECVVLIDEGHPYADGRSAVIVVDNDEGKIIRSASVDGGRRAPVRPPERD
jgi:hypothetical protein